MSTYVFTDGYTNINATDMSTKVKSVELNVTVDEQDNTAMGATYKSRQGGLKDGSLKLTFNQDMAAATVDAVIWPLLGTTVTFEVRATSAAVGAGNPKYTGSVLITEWNPLAGSVGDLAEVSVTWPTSGTVARATA